MPFLRFHTHALVVCASMFATSASAFAATPISVQAGAQFPLQAPARSAGGSTQIAVGLNYDFGPRTIVPIRASFQLDDANGAGGNGSVNEFGVGVAGRLTTPIYAGAGISIYNVNVRPNLANAGTASVTGVGTNFFVGEHLFGLPGGTDISVQATYKQLPSVAGINPSSVGLGLRVQL